MALAVWYRLYYEAQRGTGKGIQGSLGVRVVIRQQNTGSDEVVVPLDRLRHLLEERLMGALDSWDAEKKHLEEAVARAEAKEREFREIAEDVKRRLDALDLVSGMALEVDAEVPGERALGTAESLTMLSAALEEKPTPFGASSRPLFSASQRARAGQLSILP